MVVTMDIGNEDDIHPKNKREIGRRFALLALANDHEKDVVFSGPRLRKSRFYKARAHLIFDYANDGLVTRDGKSPDFFEIAGPDKVFHPATAIIDGNTLSVSSPSVQNPKAVRFAFSNLASPNLTNTANLPAQPFRTDDW
jgi:sialate O-acetylesterase